MINEFGESINDEEIEAIVAKTRKLSPKQIDNFWYKCGWIDSEKEPENKSLPRKRIKMIKENNELAMQHVISLLLETPKGKVYRVLPEVDKK